MKKHAVNKKVSKMVRIDEWTLIPDLACWLYFVTMEGGGYGTVTFSSDGDKETLALTLMNPVSPAKLTYQEGEFEMPRSLEQEIAKIRFRIEMSRVSGLVMDNADGEVGAMVQLYAHTCNLTPTSPAEDVDELLRLMREFNEEVDFFEQKDVEKTRKVVEGARKLFATGKK